jgi:HAD superfamily hydrolase (TIGR01509 family)
MVSDTSSLRAVIFDMDGVLIDSEPIATRVITREARKFGAEITHEDLEAGRGMLGRVFWAFIKKRYRLPESAEYYMNAFDVGKEIAEYSPEILAPGCRELLADLREASVLIGLATSGSRRRVEAVLEIMQWTETFDTVVCAADVTEGKPDPEIFLLAAERLGVAPGNCLVFEDSGRGIEAARAAGMVAVGYTGLGATADSLAAADHLLADFRNVTVADLRGVWSAHR